MKKIFLILTLVLTCSISYAKGIERVSATYEYISDNPNETPEEAERMAFEKAREKALENQFGIDVNRINTTYISNKTGENNGTERNKKKCRNTKRKIRSNRACPGYRSQ